MYLFAKKTFVFTIGSIKWLVVQESTVNFIFMNNANQCEKPV